MVTGSESASMALVAWTSISVIALLLEPADGAAEVLVLEEQRGVVGTEVTPPQVQPTVDEQGLSGDVARQVRQQKQDGARLLLGSPTPTHRDGLAIAIGILVGVGA